MSLLEFAPQCCDASIYLKIGKLCAEQGVCYNGLRPMGAAYWFSLPYRFGLPPASLIVGHYFLLAISVILSAITANRLCKKKFGRQTTALTVGLMVLGSLAIHIFFLFPVIRTSLSDTPAGLFALIATWLLLLSPEGHKQQLLVTGCAGLALGMAAWLRAFYLYPVLVVLCLWLLATPWSNKKTSAHLAMLCALIPIGAQYWATFNASHKISYLDPETSTNWSQSHLDSTITGYDTILPFDYHTWYAPCEYYSSLYDSLKTADVRSIACIIAGRTYFYFGSYSPYPYLPAFEHAFPEEKQISFDPLLNEINSPDIKYYNLVQEASTAIQPLTPSGEKIPVIAKRFSKLQRTQDATIAFTTKLERGNTYRFEMLLWSPAGSHDILVELTDPNHKKIAGNSTLVTPTLNKVNRYYDPTLVVKIDKTGQYNFTISSNKLADDSWQVQTAKKLGISGVNEGDFYFWNVNLVKTKYHEPGSRIWSTALLLLNLAALLLATLFFFRLSGKGDPGRTIILLLPFICLALSVCIVPEQRFALYPQIFTGWCSLTLLIQFLSNKNWRETNHGH